MGSRVLGRTRRVRGDETPETQTLTQTGSAADAPTTATPTTANPTDATAAPLTRRALREAEGRGTRTPVVRATGAPVRAARPAQRTSGVRRTGAASTASPLGVDRAASTTATASSRKRKFMAPVVLAVAAGMFGTMAVPAAFASTQANGASETATAEQAVRADQSQQFDVSAAAGTADTSRDGYGATSTATLDAAKHSAEVEAARAAAAAQYASYQGKTAQQYLAAAKPAGTASAVGTAATAVAPGTPFSLPAVVATAKQYIGTPYVFGGATPAGFDCSGFVMFVYAQYGINLAHSVPLQDHAGTTIPESQAQPGDVVIFNSEAHDGFYMGNGMIMDAPKPGGSISIRPIWTSDYHIVRFGV
jgi:cell wall-associated NlpC family hydrolase